MPSLDMPARRLLVGDGTRHLLKPMSQRIPEADVAANEASFRRLGFRSCLSGRTAAPSNEDSLADGASLGGLNGASLRFSRPCNVPDRLMSKNDRRALVDVAGAAT